MAPKKASAPVCSPADINFNKLYIPELGQLLLALGVNPRDIVAVRRKSDLVALTTSRVVALSHLDQSFWHRMLTPTATSTATASVCAAEPENFAIYTPSATVSSAASDVSLDDVMSHLETLATLEDCGDFADDLTDEQWAAVDVAERRAQQYEDTRGKKISEGLEDRASRKK